jgi:hypothetical protein
MIKWLFMYIVTDEQFAQNFWTRTRREGECLIWTGPTIKSGNNVYRGQVNRHRKKILAYRFAYTLSKGAIPDGLQVMHSCDVPLCVEPSHLFLGTQADNMQDMVRKGRASWQARPETRARGSRHGMAKFDEENIRNIRLCLAAGIARSKIASFHGVSHGLIGQIARRRIWRHV